MVYMGHHGNFEEVKNDFSYLVINDVESKHADGVDRLLLPARPEPVPVAGRNPEW